MRGRVKRYEDMTPAEKAIADAIYAKMNDAQREAYDDYQERHAAIRDDANERFKAAGLWVEDEA